MQTVDIVKNGNIITKMKQKLYYTTYRPLLPLTRILLHKGITCHETTQILKQVYVAVAEQKLLESTGKATTSRIAISTGLTRKDVAMIRKTAPKAETVSKKYNRAMRVTTGWQNDEEFCTSGGLPAVLTIHGKKRSFETLVQRYSGNMTTKAMLDELEANHVVQRIEDKYVTLLNDAYPTIDDNKDDEAISTLGKDVSLLISTIGHNMANNKKEPWFQRKVAYDNLPAECLKNFQQMITNSSQRILEKANNWLPQHEQENNMTTENCHYKRAGIGIYYFEEDRLT